MLVTHSTVVATIITGLSGVVIEVTQRALLKTSFVGNQISIFTCVALDDSTIFIFRIWSKITTVLVITALRASVTLAIFVDRTRAFFHTVNDLKQSARLPSDGCDGVGALIAIQTDVLLVAT